MPIKGRRIYFGHPMISGKSKNLSRSLKFASAAAAINITRIGASSGNPTLEEVINFLEEREKND